MKSPVHPSSAFRMTTALAVVLVALSAPAQSRRFELTSHFTFLDVGERVPGFGATLTYNATRRLGLESTLNFFPGDPRSNLGSRLKPVLGGWNVGNILQGQFGAKAAVVRFKEVQVFLKAKPGFLSFSNVRYSASGVIGGVWERDSHSPCGTPDIFCPQCRWRS